MFVITNMTDHDLIIDGVSIDPHQQLSISAPSEEMLLAKEAGTLRILSDEETSKERHSDVKAINDGVANMDKILNG